MVDEAPANSPEAWSAASKLFPLLRLRLGNGAMLLLPPRRYLFALSNGDFCLGVFDNGAEGTIIGGVAGKAGGRIVRGRFAGLLPCVQFCWVLNR
jgi:hypothetical protein